MLGAVNALSLWRGRFLCASARAYQREQFRSVLFEKGQFSRYTRLCSLAVVYCNSTAGIITLLCDGTIRVFPS
ncbi:hypothetical protein THTE_2716 [Thermogutta terrifontis]|uniref:Uncharacterized protein n=1 Tax=Thermogutta terrifontis TaxID=1331910 RepID=A0A286RH89_9BACT|nr:hypothetical protein THTE_2716 [Thermogutta terrifontis]